MLIFIITVVIIFSGCVEESKVNRSAEQVNQSTESINQSIEPLQKESANQSSTNLSSEEENIPEIEITSFSSINNYKNDKPISEKIDVYLFSWDNVPGNENQRLISYLKNDLNISWVDNAQIIKTNNNKAIRVFTTENSLNLTIGNNESTILTTIGSIPLCYLQIKKENGKICVYRAEEYKSGYNITEKYYAAYNISIKNNGSKNLDFKLNELHVRDGDQVFNTTHEPEIPRLYRSEILSDFEK